MINKLKDFEAMCRDWERSESTVHFSEVMAKCLSLDEVFNERDLACQFGVLPESSIRHWVDRDLVPPISVQLRVVDWIIARANRKMLKLQVSYYRELLKRTEAMGNDATGDHPCCPWCEVDQDPYRALRMPHAHVC